MGWHEDRFTESDGKLRFDCVMCAKAMWFPKSKHGKYLCCGPECSQAKRDLSKAGRSRACQTCGETFTPRPAQIAQGHGRFCSQRCNTAGQSAMLTPDAKKKASETWKRKHQENPIVKSGPAHPSWKGGAAESTRRRIESGRMAEAIRNYRKANPEKVREFRARRGEKKYGRLPKGTVARIGELQRWRCAVCRKSLKSGYHMDHHYPLALGGLHEPNNIQLLCPTCNVRKSAKHPVDFMRERGFLL